MTIKNLYKNKDEEELLKLTGETAGETAPAVKVTGFDDSAYQANKPTYTSGYAGEIDTLLDSIESRPSFSYDPESDPLYRQYETQYRREGSRAVDDTLAAAASLAGGMNSYAVTAAQQAGDYYNAQLMDRIPELAALAYEMYQTDYDRDLDRLALLRAQEAEEYDRYQDALADWYAQLESAYQQHRDSVSDSQWRESFDYQKQQDEQAYRQWLEELAYSKEQDAIDNAYRQDSFEYGKTQDAIDNAYRQDSFEYGKAQDAGQAEAADPYAGTDYYQQAIDAALRGDRDAAEAALEKRAAKMASPDYRGTGGGTSMEEAYAYIESLLAGTTKKEAEEISGLMAESVWKHQRDNYLRTGSGAPEVTEYPTYEDYVKAYIEYLEER